MAEEDVRYRLSAEGVAEVVAAFRKVSQEAQKSSKQTASGFEALTGALAGVTRFIGAIGAAFASAKIAHQVFQIAAAAGAAGEQLQNLGRRFASSAAEMNVLRIAAERSGAGLEDLAPALTGVMNATREASQNLGGEVAQKFRDVGLSLKEIEGFGKQGLAQRLETIGRALNRLPDGPQRADAAIALLGPRAAKLLPVIEALGAKGMRGLAKEAEGLSSFLSDDMIESLARLDDSFDAIRITLRGLGEQFSVGLSGPMTGAAVVMVKSAADGQDAWRKLGEFTGAVVAGIVLALDDLIDRITTLTKKMVALASLNFKKIERLDQDFQNRGVDRILRFQNALDTDPRKKAAGDGEGGERPDAAAKVAQRARLQAERARLQAEKAAIDAEFSLTRTYLKFREEQEQRAFDDNLISIQEYYARRRQILEVGIDTERTALQKQRVLALDEREKGLADVKKIDSQIEQLAIDRASKLADIAASERRELREFAEEQLTAQFDEAGRAITDLARQRAGIEDRARAGLLSQIEAQERIEALEKQRIARLRDISEELLRIAAESGDPNRIQDAADFAATVDQVSLSIEALNNDLRLISSGGIDIAQDALADFLGTGIREAPTFAAAMGNALRQVGAALQQLAAQLLAAEIFRSLFKLFGSTGGTGIFEGIAGGPSSSVRRFALGGVVPGAGASDSVPSMLPGEYVVRAAAVPGALGLLEEINRGALDIHPMAYQPRRYAAGGLVAPGPSPGSDVGLNATLGLEDGLVVRHLETPAGERAVIRILSKNRRAASRALGGS